MIREKIEEMDGKVYRALSAAPVDIKPFLKKLREDLQRYKDSLKEKED